MTSPAIAAILLPHVVLDLGEVSVHRRRSILRVSRSGVGLGDLQPMARSKIEDARSGPVNRSMDVLHALLLDRVDGWGIIVQYPYRLAH